MITEVFFLLPKWFLKKRPERCSVAQTLKYRTTAECARICEGALYLESPTASLLMSKVFLFRLWFKTSRVKREQRGCRCCFTSLWHQVAYSLKLCCARQREGLNQTLWFSGPKTPINSHTCFYLQTIISKVFIHWHFSMENLHLFSNCEHEIW